MWVYMPEGRDGLIAALRRGTIVEVNDGGSQQFLKRARGFASEQFEDVYRAQVHGFSSNPPAGSEGLFLSLGGRSDRAVALGFEHEEHRPRNLPPGGAALYDASGKVLKFLPDNTDLDAGGKKLVIHNSPDIVVGTGERFIRIRPHRVDLAIKSPTEEAPHKVVTEAGPSDVVFARLD